MNLELHNQRLIRLFTIMEHDPRRFRIVSVILLANHQKRFSDEKTGSDWNQEKREMDYQDSGGQKVSFNFKGVNLKRVQAEHKEWAEKNFGKQEGYQALLGVSEEVGELCHAHLKMEQGVRTNEDHVELAKDAVGDVVIFLINYCNLMGYDFNKIVGDTWDHVKQRDWTKNKQDGVI